MQCVDSVYVRWLGAAHGTQPQSLNALFPRMHIAQAIKSDRFARNARNTPAIERDNIAEQCVAASSMHSISSWLRQLASEDLALGETRGAKTKMPRQRNRVY